MHRSYFLFEKQGKEITPLLVGSSIERTFTYRKNELTFQLTGKEEVYLKISVDVNYPYFLITERHNIRQPRFDVFKELSGQKIHKVEIQPHDKQVLFSTDDYRILVIFYGSHPNIFLLDPDMKLMQSFKNDLPEIFLPQPGDSVFDFRTIPAQHLKDLVESEPNQKLGHFFRRRCQAINKTMTNEIIFRLGVAGDTPLKDLSDPDALHRIFRQIATELTDTANYLYYQNDQLLKIAPFPLRHMEATENTEVKTFSSVNEAWRRFVEEKPQSERFHSLHRNCWQVIEKRLRYLTNSLQKLKASEDVEKFKQEAELKGNLLLTFKNQIPGGARFVELENIFSETQEKIRIKLNPKLSATENASRYFNKYKDLRERMEILTIKKQTLEKDLKEIIRLKEKLEQSTKLKKLEQLHQELVQQGLLQNAGVKNNKEPLHPQQFHRIILDAEWDIYIGKNDRNNELLTFSFAKKWDVWLHAQGVPGSHVIIRVPRRDRHPPAKIIEQAARIAAAYSRAKHSATVPVIYTEVRFVRRLRKAAPGTVSVQNEKVIFVSPMKLSG